MMRAGASRPGSTSLCCAPSNPSSEARWCSCLEGLGNLYNIAGTLDLEGNAALASLAGFSSLSEVREVRVVANPKLTVAEINSFESSLRERGFDGPFER